MENNCQNIQEQILELITGAISPEKSAELQRHINSCPSCSEYLQALQADDKLLGDFTKAMEPTVARVENNVIGALNLEPSTGQVKCISGWRKIMKGPIIRIAAAAVLLIAVGYAGGRLWPARELDAEQLHALESSLKSSLEPAIRRDVIGQLNRDWQLALAGSHVQLKDELNQQLRRDLNEFAIQILTASGAVTNQRLTELVQAINAAQTRDRRWFAAALEQIELNRLQDNSRLRTDLATFAVQTGDELRRTRQDVAEWIAYNQPDNLVPDESEKFEQLKRKE